MMATNREDKKVKKLIALFALALPLVGQAEALQQVPWRCKTERTVGVDVSENLRPVNFSTRNEYRIMPMDKLMEKFSSEEQFSRDRYARDYFERRAKFEKEDSPGIGVAFIRDVSQNPDTYTSWRSCSVYSHDAYKDGENEYISGRRSHPGYLAYVCIDIIGELKFVTLSRKFTVEWSGQWTRTDSEGNNLFIKDATSDDYAIEFGTCEPYYD